MLTDFLLIPCALSLGRAHLDFEQIAASAQRKGPCCKAEVCVCARAVVINIAVRMTESWAPIVHAREILSAGMLAWMLSVKVPSWAGTTHTRVIDHGPALKEFRSFPHVPVRTPLKRHICVHALEGMAQDLGAHALQWLPDQVRNLTASYTIFTQLKGHQ